MDTPLYFFYHVYADGHWEQPAIDQFSALWQSGLLKELSGIYVGLVGSHDNIHRVKTFLNEAQIEHTVVCEVPSGFEQETLDKLSDFSKDHDGYVLYSHSKGAGYPVEVSASWRKSMIWHTVMRWRECVNYLKSGHTTVGSHWFEQGGPEHGGWSFWGGTFWWAKLADIRLLNKPTRTSRYDAEHWIGELAAHMTIVPFDMHPGPIAHGHLTDTWEVKWPITNR